MTMKQLIWKSSAVVLTTTFFATLQTMAVPLNATLSLKSGKVTAGYVTGAESDGILLSVNPEGGGASKIPNDQIVDLNMEEPKGWSTAVTTFTAGNYEAAEKMFASLANEYDALVPLRDSYGSLARLYYFRCLQQLGKLAELATAMDKQLANQLSLGDFYRGYYDEVKGWSILGKEDWLALGSYVQSYEEEQIGSALPQKPFQKISESRIAALCFLRAKWHESQNNQDMALVDYHRAITYNLGADRSLRAKSLAESLRILAGKLEKKPTDKTLQNRAYAVAVLYRDLAGKGEVPEAYKPLLTKPESTEPPAPPKAEEKPAEAAPATEEAPPAAE